MKKKKSKNIKFYYTVMIVSLIFSIFNLSITNYLLFTILYLLIKILDNIDILNVKEEKDTFTNDDVNISENQTTTYDFVVDTKENKKDMSIKDDENINENQTTIYDFIGGNYEDK